MTATDFCIYMKGRKEIILLDYLLHLQILCIGKSLPPNSSLHFFFFFFYWNPLCLNSQSLFLGCKLVPLYLFFNFSYKEHQRLLSSSIWLISLSVQSFKVHPPRNQWHNFLILVVLFFHSARLSDGPLSIWNTFS